MLRAKMFLQDLIILNFLLHLTINIAAISQIAFKNNESNVLSFSPHCEAIQETKKLKWLKSRVQYYSNTSASYKLTTTAILTSNNCY